MLPSNKIFEQQLLIRSIILIMVEQGKKRNPGKINYFQVSTEPKDQIPEVYI